MHDALTRLLEPVRGLRSIALVAVLALGSASLVAIGRTPDAPRSTRVQLSRVHCIEGAAERAAKRLEPITLERRWLVGSFASPAEVDAALGKTIAAWEPFTYMFDSQPRTAIASAIYPTSTLVEHAFGRDTHGGIWLVDTTQKQARTTVGPVGFTRDIYLLPVGSSYRGVATSER